MAFPTPFPTGAADFTTTYMHPVTLSVVSSKIFLARGWEIDKMGGAQIFIVSSHCSSHCELSTEQKLIHTCKH